MSITLPTSWPVGGRVQYSARSTIDAEDFKALAQGLNYLFACEGELMGGAVYPSGKSISSGGTTLADLTPVGLFDRVLDGDMVGFELRIYGTELSDVTANIVNAKTASSTSLAAAQTSASLAGADATKTVSYAGVTDDGTVNGTPALMYGEMSATGDSTTGTLYGWALSATFQLSASDLPDGV